MKIIGFRDFLAMPPGTLFATYTAYCFGDLSIKGESLPNDYFYQDMINPAARDFGDLTKILEIAEYSGNSFENDLYCMGREGLFDESQLYAVFEQKDLDNLIERLIEAKHEQTA